VVINDILDFSKLEADKLEIDPVDFSLTSVVEDTTEFFSQLAAQKGLELSCVVAPDVPGWLRGGGDRVRQVLTNLIGNAIKFTEKGGVTLRVSRIDGTPGTTRVLFEINDTGPGISSAVQKRLFQAFTQADGSTTRRHGGTGLGLAICRRLVEMMGGTIDLESKLGEGSRFWFQLPLADPLEPKEPGADPFSALEGLRVLVVDDVESNRTIVNQYMSSWKMQPDSARNGLEAMVMIRGAEEKGQRYGLVLLDYGMAGMNGVDVARVIKADPKIAATPNIMVTSFSEPINSATAKEAGIGAVLTKPVRKQQLRKAICKVLVAAAPHEERQEVKRPDVDRIANLLLVEDNPDNQKLSVRLLAKHGYSCDVASNGLEALKSMAIRNYSMVLMDCQMPWMDGFQATAIIREREKNLRHTPVVAMTAHALAGDKEKCLAAGMDDYLPKPINEGDLIRTIERWVMSADRIAPDAAISIGDLAEVRVDDLLPDYLAHRREDIFALHRALEAGDLEGVAVIGHEIKGSGSLFGFPQITEIGRKIQKSIHDRDVSGVRLQITNLENYMLNLKSTDFERGC
jgi:CheY-like chemotaxis protein/HPt (histidine-containing phosphotransfer) domain-containing protein